MVLTSKWGRIQSNIVKHSLHVCSKVNTALQFLLIAVSLGAPVLGLQHHPSLHYLWAATGATTFLSAVSYAFMKVRSEQTNRSAQYSNHAFDTGYLQIFAQTL